MQTAECRSAASCRSVTQIGHVTWPRAGLQNADCRMQIAACTRRERRVAFRTPLPPSYMHVQNQGQICVLYILPRPTNSRAVLQNANLRMQIRSAMLHTWSRAPLRTHPKLSVAHGHLKFSGERGPLNQKKHPNAATPELWPWATNSPNTPQGTAAFKFGG